MSGRRLKWWLLLPVVLLVAALIAALLGYRWLLTTPGGARWALAQMVNVRPGLVRFAEMEGTLRDGLSVRGLVVSDESFQLLVGELRTKARPGVLPWAVTLEDLGARGVELNLSPDESAPVRSISERLSSLRLPLNLTLRSSRIEDVAVARDAVPWFSIDAVSLSGEWSDQLRGVTAQIEAPSWSVSLEGDLELAYPWNADLSGLVRWSDPLVQQGEARLDLLGDGSGIAMQLAAPQHGLKADGEITEWLDRPVFDVDVDGAQFAWSEPDSGFTVHGLQAHIQGEPEAYAWQLAGQLGWPDGAEAPWTASGTGDLEALAIQALQLGPNPLELSGNGRLAWLPDFSLDLAVEASIPEPGRWIADWPGTHPAQGKAKLIWNSNRFELPDFTLGIAGTDARIEGTASWHADVGAMQAELAWKDLAWPIAATPVLVSSPAGTATLSGTPGDWAIMGRLTARSGDYPEAEIRVEAHGDQDSTEWRLEPGAFAGGRVGGEGRAGWREGFNWQADLQLENVDAGALWPQWPARVNGRLAMGQSADDATLKLRIRDGQATLQGHTLAVSGGVDITGSDIRFQALDVSEPGSRIQLDGGWNTPDLLGFEADIQRPGLMAEMLGTELEGRGRLGVSSDRPVFEGRLAGNDAEWGDWRLQKFKVTAGTKDQAPSLHVAMEGLVQDDWQLPHAEAELAGPWGDQVLEARLEFDENLALDEAVLRARGGWQQWRDPSALAWAGTLQELSLIHEGRAVLALDNEATLTLGAREISMGDACFDAIDGGRFCGRGGYREGDALQFSGELQDWPLAGLLGPLTPGITYTQRLDGRLAWRHRPGERPSGQADLLLSAGSFGPGEDEEALVHTGQGRFGFAMDDGQLHSGKLAVGFGAQGSLEIDWGISNVVLDGSGELSGTAHIHSLDLSVLNSLWPDVDRIGGRFDADLLLGGRVSNPNFEGDFSLAGARFDYATLGLALTDLDLQGRVASNDQLSFAGPFVMGEGSGQLTGQLDFADLSDPVWNLRVTGQRLRVADLPTLQVNADPDIQLSGRGDQYRISGEVTIPDARIAPNSTIFSRVSESDDVVIVAGALPEAAPEAEERPANLGGRLAVRLGSDVRLKMDTVDTRLTGEVVLRWPQDLMPTADGQILVNGDVRVFGPLLHIDDGRVRFNGGPADNPQLSIRAARDVFGNTQVQTAGVLVTGSAKAPDIQAYTDPLTTSERAWGLLITGQDFEYGQGIGAFDIGTYIAPRLYLSYGVSLVDEGSVVSLRYDLRRGFGIKATSSQTENGVDISYTLISGRKRADEATAVEP